MGLKKTHIDLIDKYLSKKAKTAVSFGYPELKWEKAPESYKFFKEHLGLELTVYDIKNYGHGEHYVDLNRAVVYDSIK